MEAFAYDFAPGPRRVSRHAADTLALLNHLRFVSMRCRAKPRAELFEACALLEVTRDRSLEAHADALTRCLSQAIGTQAKFLAPGTDETTFDEDWLLELAQACARSDEASVTFLLASRVERQYRRLVRFLVARISEHFYLT